MSVGFLRMYGDGSGLCNQFNIMINMKYQKGCAVIVLHDFLCDYMEHTSPEHHMDISEIFDLPVLNQVLAPYHLQVLSRHTDLYIMRILSSEGTMISTTAQLFSVSPPLLVEYRCGLRLTYTHYSQILTTQVLQNRDIDYLHDCLIHSTLSIKTCLRISWTRSLIRSATLSIYETKRMHCATGQERTGCGATCLKKNCIRNTRISLKNMSLPIVNKTNLLFSHGHPATSRGRELNALYDLVLGARCNGIMIGTTILRLVIPIRHILFLYHPYFRV